MNDQLELPAAVLFDMDGTLIDSEHQWLRAETTVMAQFDVHWTTDDQKACLGGPLDRAARYMVAMVGPGHRVGVDEMMELLLGEMEALMRTEPVDWRPGAKALLRESHDLGVPTALVTASWRRLIEAVHEAIAADLGRDPFAVVIGGDEVASGKPHPEPYLTAAAALGVDPADCLVVEDSPTGVAAGHAAGCLVVAVPHMAAIEPADRIRIVPSLEGRTLAELWQQPSVGDSLLVDA